MWVWRDDRNMSAGIRARMEQGNLEKEELEDLANRLWRTTSHPSHRLYAAYRSSLHHHYSTDFVFAPEESDGSRTQQALRT